MIFRWLYRRRVISSFSAYLTPQARTELENLLDSRTELQALVAFMPLSMRRLFVSKADAEAWNRALDHVAHLTSTRERGGGDGGEKQR